MSGLGVETGWTISEGASLTRADAAVAQVITFGRLDLLCGLTEGL